MRARSAARWRDAARAWLLAALVMVCCAGAPASAAVVATDTDTDANANADVVTDTDAEPPTHADSRGLLDER